MSAEGHLWFGITHVKEKLDPVIKNSHDWVCTVRHDRLVEHDGVLFLNSREVYFSGAECLGRKHVRFSEMKQSIRGYAKDSGFIYSE